MLYILNTHEINNLLLQNPHNKTQDPGMNSRFRRRKLPVFKILSEDELEERGWQLIMLSLRLVSLDGNGHLP